MRTSSSTDSYRIRALRVAAFPFRRQRALFPETLHQFSTAEFFLDRCRLIQAMLRSPLVPVCFRRNMLSTNWLRFETGEVPGARNRARFFPLSLRHRYSARRDLLSGELFPLLFSTRSADCR